MSEQVNHPSHYNIPGKKECIVQMREDYGEYITAIFCLTNAYKYLYRAGIKEGNSKEQDIAKAKWYYSYMVNELDYEWRDVNFNFNKLYKYVRKELEKYGSEA